MKRFMFVHAGCILGMALICSAADAVSDLTDAERHLEAIGDQCQRSQLALGPVYTAGTATYTLPEGVLRFLAFDRDIRESALRKYEAVADQAVDRGLLVRIIRTITSLPAYTVIEPPDSKVTRLRVFQYQVSEEK